MITVHHLENSRSQRVLWLIEELGEPYTVVRYERDRKTMMAPPELRKVHPLGKSPAVDVDGTVLVETGAIVEYLVDRAKGRLGPPQDFGDTLLWRQYLHYAEGSMMPPLLAILVVGRLGLLGRPARKPLQAMLDQHLRFLESELARRPWFAGHDFTAADIMMSFPLEASRQRGGLDARYPKLTAWLDRIHRRPGYQAALARGGPYAFA